MNSFLIISNNSKTTNIYIQTVCKKLQIEHFDITSVGEHVDKKDKTPKSIGIEDIRKIGEKIFLKPITSEIKALIVYHCELLTLQAQNALLKLLEEPPKNTVIFLVSSSKEILLPTILSRCSIEEINEKKEIVQNTMLISTILSASISSRLLLAATYAKSKDEALAFLEELILSARKQLITENSLLQKRVLLQTIRQLQKTHMVIQTTNISVRLALEACLLRVSQNGLANAGNFSHNLLS